MFLDKSSPSIVFKLTWCSLCIGCSVCTFYFNLFFLYQPFHKPVSASLNIFHNRIFDGCLIFHHIASQGDCFMGYLYDVETPVYSKNQFPCLVYWNRKYLLFPCFSFTQSWCPESIFTKCGGVTIHPWRWDSNRFKPPAWGQTISLQHNPKFPPLTPPPAPCPE